MSFSTKGMVVADGVGISKYLSYGINEAAIVGFELRTAKSGKQQVILNMESPRVKEAGFEPDPASKFGGKVGRVVFTIYFADGDEAMKEFLGKIAIIAKKFGVSEAVDSISAGNLNEYMTKVLPLIGNKFAYWAITAEEYQKKDSDKVGYTLGLRRYGFIATKEEMDVNPSHLKPFDKSDRNDYKALALPSPDPDTSSDPISDAFGAVGDTNTPW